VLETISRNFKYRIGLSLILVAAILLLIIYSHVPMMDLLFTGAVAFVACHGLTEFYQMVESKKIVPLYWVGLSVGFILIFSIFEEVSTPKHAGYPLIIFFSGLLIAFLYMFTQNEKKPLLQLSTTFFGLIYVTIPISFSLFINYRLDQGQWWLFYILFLTKISDTGAYFIGKTFGKHLLVPVISPKKTIEGMIGGIVVPLAFSLIVPLFSTLVNGADPFHFTLSGHLLFAFLISLLAQAGDLAESLLKRDAKIKDSNKWPGLGGTLDIIDSLIFTLPFSYLYLTHMVET